MIVALSPNPSIDRFFLLAAPVAPGTIHRPELLVTTAGGKGFNVARAARSLGGEVRTVALLAGHAGRWIAEELAEVGIETDVIWTSGETRTCLSVADERSGAPTEFYEHGIPFDPAEWDRFVARSAAVSAGDWVTISGSMPAGIDPERTAELIVALRAAGARVAVDQHGPALAAAVAAAPDLVKVNASEAEELTGEGDPRRAATALAAQLSAARRSHRLGRAMAIVTAGEAGAYAIGPDGTGWRATLDVRGPFPNGSGDTFLAGLLVGLAEQRDRVADATRWPTALALALAAAAANAELPGAGRIDPRRARALVPQATVTPSG